MSILSRLLNVFRKDQLDRDLDDELRFHAEQRAADLGLTPDEALRRVGNTARLTEESRDAKLAVWLETLVQDLRLAWRVWHKRPIVTIAAILTLALGVGMNVAVFQLIWNVMLKPLPYPQVDRLAQIWIDASESDWHPPQNTVIEKWRDTSQTVARFAAYRPWNVTVVSGGDPEIVLAGLVSPEFFDVFGVPLQTGRALSDAEMKEGAGCSILLRESYVHQRFHGDPAILGKAITVDGTQCTVAGIVSNTFAGTPVFATSGNAYTRTKAEPKVYLPLSRAVVGGMTRPIHTSFVVAQLKDGVTTTQAAQELTSLARPEEKNRTWLSPLETEVGFKFRPSLYALIAATGCILLIACANLANLLLAQAVLRRRELAVRIALGAGRARVLRQLVTEALALSFVGGVAGMLIANILSRGIVALYPGLVPRLDVGGTDWLVYLFAFVCAIASGLLFGVLPSLRAINEAGDAALRVGGAWMTRGSRRWVNVMVGSQAGLTVMVLIAAGLLYKSLVLLRDVDTGIARQHLITASIDLPRERYKERPDRARFGARLVERFSTIPGVSSAAVTNSLPLRYTGLLTVRFRVPGFPDEIGVNARSVSGRYFETMGMKWVAGGLFDERDTNQIVVNESFVRKFLDGKQPVDYPLPQGKFTLTIKGVVKDIRFAGLNKPPEPEVYMPYASFPVNPVDTAVRTTLPPAQIVAAMRRELRAVDDQVALSNPMTIEEVIGAQVAMPRFQTVLLALFAFVAIALAAIGTYGVIAYNVRSRISEIGLRRALGAQTRELLWLVLNSGMKAPLIGLITGVTLSAFVAGPLLRSLLFGITARDVTVTAAAVAIVAITSLVACLVPGRSAARVEPSIALRHE